MNEPLRQGASKGNIISRDDLALMLDEYYAARGWDRETGIPKREKLEQLGLGYAAEELDR
jgi:aldehyde:ferredoxin oxidoreductase